MSSLSHLRTRIFAVGGVIVFLLVAGIWITLTHASAQPSSASSGSGSTSAGGSATSSASPSASAVASGPLSLVSASPQRGARGINGANDIKLQFSAPVAADSPLPKLKPAIPGTWSGQGTSTLQFAPAKGFSQLTKVTVKIPGGTAGIKSTAGGLLAQATKLHFTTGAYSSTRLAELLSQLGYLPLTWTAASGATVPAATDTHGQLLAAYTPPQGSYAWQSGWPAKLKTFWDNGSSSSMMLKGAVMAFEGDHGIVVDGDAGPEVWSALLKAVASNDMNKKGYTYALASEGNPERLTVWHNGKIIMRSLANTGIAAAPTTLGTAPVYIRYYYQIMKGKNPDGSKYADPVYYVAYFRAGEAVHYFSRGSYGYPQSLGCVELPWASAKFIWKYMNYGTLVTVARGSLTPGTSPVAN